MERAAPRVTDGAAARQVGVAGAVLGLAVGIGAPLFYISRDERDDARLEELRQLNRQTFKETGEYLSEARGLPLAAPTRAPLPASAPRRSRALWGTWSGRLPRLLGQAAAAERRAGARRAQEEIKAIRQPRWTDRRCAAAAQAACCLAARRASSAH